MSREPFGLYRKKIRGSSAAPTGDVSKMCGRMARTEEDRREEGELNQPERQHGTADAQGGASEDIAGVMHAQQHP